jgi:hypothetical protein
MKAGMVYDKSPKPPHPIRDFIHRNIMIRWFALRHPVRKVNGLITNMRGR